MYEFLSHPFRVKGLQDTVLIIILFLVNPRSDTACQPAAKFSLSRLRYVQGCPSPTRRRVAASKSQVHPDVGLGTLHGRGRLAILRRQIWVRAEPMIVHTYTAGKSIQSPVENFGTKVLKISHHAELTNTTVQKYMIVGIGCTNS